MSGNELGYWAVIKPLMKPEKYILEVAKELDCNNDDTMTMVDCLREVDALKLMNTTFECPVGPFPLSFMKFIACMRIKVFNRSTTCVKFK